MISDITLTSKYVTPLPSTPKKFVKGEGRGATKCTSERKKGGGGGSEQRLLLFRHKPLKTKTEINTEDSVETE